MVAIKTVSVGRNEGDKSYSFLWSEGPFFIFITSHEPFNQEQTTVFTEELKKTAPAQPISGLTSFETYLQNWIRSSHLPTVFSMAAAYVHDKVIYLQTVGQGAIFIVRNKKILPLLGHGSSGSGYLRSGDKCILTDSLSESAIVKDPIRKVLLETRSEEALERLKQTLPLIPAFLLCEYLDEVSIQPETPHFPTFSLREMYRDLRMRSVQAGKKKTITFSIMVICLFIFVWSVIFGYQRRTDTQARKQILDAKTSITQILERAEEENITNAAYALELITEANAHLDELKKKVGPPYKKETDEISQLVQRSADAVIKKETKTASEFYDLGVDNKEARGDHMSLDESNVAVLDKTNGKVYLISLEKKSLDTYTFAQFKKTDRVMFSGSTVFVRVPGDGILQSTGTSIKKVVQEDKDWGALADGLVYNSNIYLLDSKKSDIYKYVPVEGGYGAKTSYFKGSIPDLTEARSIAVDGSLYVGLGRMMMKYTSGLQDGFSASFPGETVSVEKVITNKNLEKIYVWDKKAGIVYVLEKSGAYVKQIAVDMFRRANDLIVYADSIYALSGQKIYSVPIN